MAIIAGKPVMRILACAALIIVSANSLAAPPPAAPLGKQSPITIHCVHYTSARYSLPRNLLWAIKEAEGAGPGVVSVNKKEGTHNLGSWQHNTITLPELQKYGVTGNALLNSECAAAYVAGWKLRKAYDKFGTWMLAVAAYNAGEGSVRKALKKGKGKDVINALPPITKNVYIPHVETALLRFAAQGEPGARQ